MLSIIVVGFLCWKLRPYTNTFSPLIIFFLTAITLWVAYISKPIYPKQLHFDYRVKCANYRKKNTILLIIISIQIFCFFAHYLIPIIYLSLGIMVSLIGLLIEHVIQYFKRREKQ